MDIKIIKDDSGYKFMTDNIQSQYYTRRRSATRGAKRKFGDVRIISPNPHGKRGEDKHSRKAGSGRPRVWISDAVRRREWNRKYRKTPAGRQKQIKYLYRFIENHPEYNIEYLEYLIRINERTISLDAPRGETNLYSFIADKRAV